ncbi:DNA-directed RNA polymerase III subunit RPC8 [Euphorbia peplus]|nr:DNA-directed RNA polymerase III subunit RPC8 [Euphorbia peplus]
MFNLCILEHTLLLPPSLMNLSLQDAINKELQRIFLDKVISDLGLCISVYDIKRIDGGFIFPGDGASTYTVEFRLVVFRPFVGEIIGAKLKESNTVGLRLSLGFFDDIYIPSDGLLKPSSFSPGEDGYQGTWSWYSNDTKAKYFVNGVDEIKFQVESVKYAPVPSEQHEKPFAPMVIMGRFDSAECLGTVSWW